MKPTGCWPSTATSWRRLAQALLKAESLNAKEIWEAAGLTEPAGQEQDTSRRLETVKK